MRQFVSAKFPFPRFRIGCVFGAGVVLSISLFFTVRQWERSKLENEMFELVRQQLDKLKVTVLRSTEVLHSIAGLYQTRGELDRQEFHRFVEQALGRQPELQAISWNPLIRAADRQAFERMASDGGRMGKVSIREQDVLGNLVSARARAEYVPVYLIEPLEGNTAALGYDLSSDAVRQQSIGLARRTGHSVATSPVHLAQKSGHDPGLLVLLPIYRRPGINGSSFEDRLAGFAVAVFRVANLIEDSMREVKSLGLEFTFYDESANGELVYTSGPALLQRPQAWVDVASRRWAVAYRPTPRYLSQHLRIQAWFCLFVGLSFSLLSTAYINSIWRRTWEANAANRALQEEVVVRKHAEALAASANQAKSDFLASLSHEIRTPLNAILGYAQLMRRDADLPGETQDAVSGIRSSGQHLLGLVNEVLDLAKIEAGRMELAPVEFDLRDLGQNVAMTFKPLCAQKRIRFRFELGDGATLRVRGDEGKLRQILINLVGNAVKFTNAGEVCLRFCNPTVGQWLFEVIDTGLGIPLEEQPNIFKPFHQGNGGQHQGGTGLGLAIAQRQTKLLGGELQLESQRGIGSKFYFAIPLDAAPGAASREAGEAIEPAALTDPLLALDLAPVTLPEALFARLMVAAELHSTTTLKAALLDLRQQGPAACVLAEQIRQRMRSYDMDGIQRLLTRLVVAASSGSAVASGNGISNQTS